MNPVVLSSQSTYIITLFASFMVWFELGGLLILWIIDGRIKKEQALHALSAGFFAWGAASMIKSIFPTLRPFQINGGLPLTVTIPADGGFPSAHTAVAFGIAVAVWLHNKSLGLLFLSLAAFTGLGRIFGNVHTEFDVIAGAVLGTLVAYAVGKLHLHKLLK